MPVSWQYRREERMSKYTIETTLAEDVALEIIKNDVFKKLGIYQERKDVVTEIFGVGLITALETINNRIKEGKE